MVKSMEKVETILLLNVNCNRLWNSSQKHSGVRSEYISLIILLCINSTLKNNSLRFTNKQHQSLFLLFVISEHLHVISSVSLMLYNHLFLATNQMQDNSACAWLSFLWLGYVPNILIKPPPITKRRTSETNIRHINLVWLSTEWTINKWFFEATSIL